VRQAKGTAVAERCGGRAWLRAALLAAGVGVCVLAAAPAQAYTVKGMGKCSSWVGGEDDRFWLLGFLSGYNFARDANVGRGDTAEAIYRWVSRYCRERPGDDLADAISAYISTQ
jgi:hypothetical protein